jgi:flagellar biosynthesis anti-sigma factor FlgM
MRIGLNTPDPQGISAQKPANSSAAASHESRPSAENGDVSLHDAASLSALATRALQTPEIRQDRVDSLRQSIASGQYRFDAKASAEAMLNQ